MVSELIERGIAIWSLSAELEPKGKFLENFENGGQQAD